MYTRRKRRSRAYAGPFTDSWEVQGPKSALETDQDDFDILSGFVKESIRQSKESKKILNNLHILEQEYSKQLRFNPRDSEDQLSEDSEDELEAWRDQIEDVSIEWSSESDSEEMSHESNREDRNDSRLADWSFDACSEEEVLCREIRGQHSFTFDPS